MEVNTSLPVPKFELGVLLVHGIGAQPSGDTLVRWGDVLLKTIRRATRNKVVVTVERAGHADWAGMDRLEAAVRFRADDHAERWLLREGWWADAFPAPSYRELVSWSVRALPWAIVTYIGGRYWQSSSLHWERRMPARAQLIVELILALLLAPVLIIFIGLSLLLGLLPIPYIRKQVLAIQSTLTATVGDSLAFVESPTRAALIRACILDGLVRLKQLCKHTVIVAHSQGAAAALDALGGIVEPGEEREAEATSGFVPDALVTFGAATNQLASQKVLAAGLPKTLGTNPAFRAGLAILATALTALALFYATRFLHATRTDHLQAVLTWLLLMLFLMVSIVLPLKLIKDEERQNRIVATWLLPIWMVVTGAVTLYEFFHNPIFLFWIFAAWALFSFVAAARSIPSSEMEKIVTAPVRRPSGLVRWDDLYASADPVPNGPTRPTGVSDTSIKIWNLGSLIADHTAYWNNRDGFVLRVARVCAETAQSPWASELPGESDSVDKRAAWRVGLLQMAWWSARLTWLVLLVLLWVWHRASIPVPSIVPDWLPRAPVQFVLLVTFIALAMWATSVVMRWPWNWWVRKEQEAVLAHEHPQGKEAAESPLNWMWMVVWTVIGAAFILMRITWSSEPIKLEELVKSLIDFLGAVMAEPDKLVPLALALGLYCFIAFGFAVISRYLSLKLIPPPSPSAL